jgi:hypothetical protein
MDEKIADTGIDSVVVDKRRNVIRYVKNPSVEGGVKGRAKVVDTNARRSAIISDAETGEIFGRGSLAFASYEEVDDAKFVKVFLEGLRQTAGLTKTGMKVFELVYRQVQANPNQDEIKLNYAYAKLEGLNLAPRTFRLGVEELLEKEFLFASMIDGLFFLNIRYMFNGDRLAFVRMVRRKGAPSQQAELPLELPLELPPLPRV